MASCNCEHCQLAVCEVCGGAEGSLTTDCPGVRITYERHQELMETNLDYTDARGWHLAPIIRAGEARPRRSPHFESTPVPPTSTRVDPRTVIMPSIDWTRIDRMTSLQGILSAKAYAWVLAERACEDATARERNVQAKAAHLRDEQNLDDHDRTLLAILERAKVAFQIACRHVETCDDEFRQAAWRLVEELEDPKP